MPKSETFVMATTVAFVQLLVLVLVLVLVTHNLAVEVVARVLVASVLFVRRVAQFVGFWVRPAML